MPALRPGDELWDAELRFAEATAARGAAGWAEWFARDGVILRRGAIVRGKNAIRDFVTPMLDDPDVSLVWSPVQGEVSAAGDLGYVFGAWEASDRDSELRGMYMTAWRREDDGWKVVADIGDVADR